MYIARQPIFNKAMQIYGYELLFRSDTTVNAFGNTSSQAATASVLGGLFEQGFEKVVGSAKAFINFDYDFIMSDTIELIDPEKLVIEVLETVKVDDALVSRLRQLKQLGYKIALDDFEESYAEYPIVPIADMIKYDVFVTPLDTIVEDVKIGLAQKKILLAEKIETQEEFQKALQMGFQLFQGYFFSKPKVLTESTGKNSSRAQYTRILQVLKKEEPTFDEIVDIIHSDVNLAYRIMRITSNRGDADAGSVRKALVKMGLKEIERWVNVLLLQDLSQKKPSELMRLSLVRSRFAEFLAENSIFKDRKDEFSMMGLFSLLDAILDQDMEVALEGMKLAPEVAEALIYGKGALEPMCHLVNAYERGDWQVAKTYAAALSIDPEILSSGYLAAIKWSSDVMKFT